MRSKPWGSGRVNEEKTWIFIWNIYLGGNYAWDNFVVIDLDVEKNLVKKNQKCGKNWYIFRPDVWKRSMGEIAMRAKRSKNLVKNLGTPVAFLIMFRCGVYFKFEPKHSVGICERAPFRGKLWDRPSGWDPPLALGLVREIHTLQGEQLGRWSMVSLLMLSLRSDIHWSERICGGYRGQLHYIKRNLAREILAGRGRTAKHQNRVNNAKPPNLVNFPIGELLSLDRPDRILPTTRRFSSALP